MLSGGQEVPRAYARNKFIYHIDFLFLQCKQTVGG